MKVKEILNRLSKMEQNLRIYGFTLNNEFPLEEISGFKISGNKIIFTISDRDSIRTVKELTDILLKTDQNLEVYLYRECFSHLFLVTSAYVYKGDTVLEAYRKRM